jgi:hypothetical protein
VLRVGIFRNCLTAKISDLRQLCATAGTVPCWSAWRLAPQARLRGIAADAVHGVPNALGARPAHEKKKFLDHAGKLHTMHRDAMACGRHEWHTPNLAVKKWVSAKVGLLARAIPVAFTPRTAERIYSDTHTLRVPDQ